MVNFLHSKFWGDLLLLLNGVALVLLLNVISARSFFRIDLTSEKRFSISTATKDMLTDLDDVVTVEIYLEGDLPAGFRRMKRSIREVLDQFAAYSGGNVRFRFIDPYSIGNTDAVNNLIREIALKGVQPTDVFLTEGGERIQKRLLPGAVVSYGGGEQGVLLFKGNKAAPPEERLNQSIEGIEFELATAIYNLTRIERKAIGILSGHGELAGRSIADLRSSLSGDYIVSEVRATETDLSDLDLLMVIKPQQSFTESEKFTIDQFLMKGGSLIYLIDKVGVDMDSVGTGTFSFPIDLNLQDQLFKYGVRINATLVQDIITGVTPIVTGNMGDQPQVQVLPWPYYPIINNFSDHIVTRNSDAVLLRFVNTIDTVRAPGVEKTPLLFTSGYSRSLAAPVRIALEDLREELPPEAFDKQNLPVAYLLEGTFRSLYANRMLPTEIAGTPVLAESPETKILVVSDGDIARNDINQNTGQALPLGFDPYSQETFGNLDFLRNSISYLLEDDGLINARSKQVAIRPLDKFRVEEERTKWQLINLILPVILVVIYGFGRYYLRKKKYTGFVTEKE